MGLQFAPSWQLWHCRLSRTQHTPEITHWAWGGGVVCLFCVVWGGCWAWVFGFFCFCFVLELLLCELEMKDNHFIMTSNYNKHNPRLPFNSTVLPSLP